VADDVAHLVVAAEQDQEVRQEDQREAETVEETCGIAEEPLEIEADLVPQECQVAHDVASPRMMSR